MVKIHGADSFHLESPEVSLQITQLGGHVAPVEFHLPSRSVSPYALAPWQPDELSGDLPVLLKNLRGDFFCLPFGPQTEGPPHGETANALWEETSRTQNSLTLRIQTTDTHATVEKTIFLRPGETTLYIDHKIQGLKGQWSYGSHPILDLQNTPEEQALISVSPFRWASVYPEWFSPPQDGATQALKIGALFSDLTKVPLAKGGNTDLSKYPARPGTDDLVMMVSEDATEAQPFAWSACVMDGFVWFSLKLVADFPATMLWLSNGGRTAYPWDSTHTRRLGIEDVCSHFCDGVDISRKDLLKNLAIPTTRSFQPNNPVSLRLIQGVAEVPEGFGKIVQILPAGPGEISIIGEAGQSITTAVDWTYLSSKKTQS